MNSEQQRIAIAEACGWTEIEPCTCCDGVSRGYSPTPGAHKKHFPDYLNDLNAMHDAEEILDASQCAEYARQLMKHHPTYCVTVLDNRFAPTEEIAYETYQLLHATASQRAEAFLRTIGKWKEAK